jgi:hypothetical protein
MTIHLTLHSPGRKTTSWSFIAFERSIEAGSDSPGNRSKLPMQILTSIRHTLKLQSNIEGFEGMGALLD